MALTCDVTRSSMQYSLHSAPRGFQYEWTLDADLTLVFSLRKMKVPKARKSTHSNRLSTDTRTVTRVKKITVNGPSGSFDTFTLEKIPPKSVQDALRNRNESTTN